MLCEKVQAGMMGFDTCPRWEDCPQMVFEVMMQVSAMEGRKIKDPK